MLFAIKKDDLRAFNALAEDFRLGGLRMGRFPVLSLLYMYGARRILSKHEKSFLKISAWEPVSEPAAVSALFSEKAGKCARLYFDDAIVTPLEMLLILDMTKRLKRAYPQVRPPEAVKERMRRIYNIKYALKITFKDKSVSLERRPLTRRERKRLVAACVCLALAIAIVIATPITAVSLLPDVSKGEVTKLSQIDFSSQNTYKLMKDIVVPADVNVQNVNCTILGNGKKLIFQKDATFGALYGTLSDISVETEGSPIFRRCESGGTLSSVDINVNADVQTSENSAFVVLINYGVLDGVRVNVRGKLSAYGQGDSPENGTPFGGLVLLNSYYDVTPAQRAYGTLKNCSVHYNNFSLEGDLAANATFGGIVGENDGVVQDCTVSGKISSQTFDVGGACFVNGRSLVNISCEASLSQVAADEGWTPIVAGITVENYGTVEQCKFSGNIEAQSSNDAIAAGITARTFGKESYCLSSGRISVVAKTASVGGVFARSEIYVYEVYLQAYVTFGVANNCLSTAEIVATLSEDGSCVGGIGGYIQQGAFGSADNVVYWGGGVANSVFAGNISANRDYAGSVVGVCGADIYLQNANVSNDKDEHNFEGNLYLEGALSAFGATFATVEEENVFHAVEDKGATPSSLAQLKASELYLSICDKLGLPA